MNTIKISHITKLILVFSSIFIFIACGSKPHAMQYLVNRSYLQDVGLSRSVSMLDLKGEEKTKSIHVGSPSDVKVLDFMTFNEEGNVLSIRKEKGENIILKLVDFKYDKYGLLQWIIPHPYYFEGFGYDSIKVEYKGGKPIQMTALKNENPIWVESIVFDDVNEKYSFKKQITPHSDELYNIYQFENKKLIAEYHRNRLSDSNIDSTKYYYRNGVLYKKSEIFNGSLVHILNYDDFGRAKKGTTMFYKKDSIAWVDKYYYLLEERIPHSVVTSSPMGWREETNFFCD